eukprot:scaffold8580_cov286-Pinguiococcus_pyrenoidosus.AAC.1
MKSKAARNAAARSRGSRANVALSGLIVSVLAVFLCGIVLAVQVQEHAAQSANHTFLADLEAVYHLHAHAHRPSHSASDVAHESSLPSRKLEHAMSGNRTHKKVGDEARATASELDPGTAEAPAAAAQRVENMLSEPGHQGAQGKAVEALQPESSAEEPAPGMFHSSHEAAQLEKGSDPGRALRPAQSTRNTHAEQRMAPDAAGASHGLLRRRDQPAVDVEATIQGYLTASQRQFVAIEHPVDATTVTVSAWVNPDAGDRSSQLGDMRTIMTNRLSGCGTTPRSFGYSIFLNNWSTSDGAIVAEWTESQGACQKLSSAPGQLPAGSWSHLVAVFDANQVTLYLNGRDVASRPSHSRLTQSNGPLVLGRVPPSGQDEEYIFYGKIARVAVFGSAFNPAQVRILHASSASQGLQHAAEAIGEAASPLLLLPLGDAELSASADATGATEYPLVEEQPQKLNAKLKVPTADYPLRRPDHSSGVAGNRAAPAAPNAPATGTANAQPSRSRLAAVGKGAGGSWAQFNIDDLNYGFDVGRSVTSAMRRESDRLGAQRSERVRDAMRHAWQGYRKYAWGKDEVRPQSASWQNNWGSMGVTLVDSLDTLWLMDLHKEFQEARDWVASRLSFARAGEVSVFETTIRELGGLLSAYDLSGDRVFLEKAQTLGDLLLPAFETSSGIPVGRIFLGRDSPSRLRGAGRSSILAEVGTLQVEFRYLSKATGNPIYAQKANRVFDLLEGKDTDGLYGVHVSTQTGSVSGKVTFGALGDSFYEYLLKVWLQGGKKESTYRKMYDRAVDATIQKQLWRKTAVSGYTVLADYEYGHAVRKMDHLACFMAGTLALGAYTSGEDMTSGRSLRDLRLGQALAHSCYRFYKATPTGLSPEYVTYGSPREDFSVPSNAPYYILRPEVSESLFVLHQITGDPIYREWGWEIFEAIEKNCKTAVAYGAFSDVRKPGIKADDRMESFFLAETLKYLYLLQAPAKKVNLRETVLNTEAHPLRSFS